MPITAIKTKIPEVLLIEPKVFEDERGFFFESFNSDDFKKVIDTDFSFLQDNHSKSAKGVLRGLHYQILRPQGKLVRVVKGAIYDVAVDIRKGSPTFGHWYGAELSSENKKQLWVPPDFAHGFLVISESAEVLYKATDVYAPEFERIIYWGDPDIGIAWPNLGFDPKLSQKDRDAVRLGEAELPIYKA